MRDNVLYILTFVLLALMATPEGKAQDERRYVRQGVAQLQNENYSAAETAFREALKIKPNSFEAGYNLATALFRQEKYEEAMQQLQATEPFAGENKDKLAQLYHNLGNNYMYGQDIDNSIEAYKKSLRQNPLDDETRYNLIAAMKMKQEQEEQEQEEEEQEQEQEQEQQQQEQQQDQDQQEQQEQQQQEEQKEEQQQQQQQESEGISRENAERLLEAIEQDEKEMMEKMNRHEEQQPVQTDKNW
ncbi:tetratricopeptide repeat protein [Geofilum rubicundum]|nr:tetratricopeptide repeat protein [Geofilum rubicundum]